MSAVFALVYGSSVHESAAAQERAVEDCEVGGDERELSVSGYCNCGKCRGRAKLWYTCIHYVRRMHT